jgi:hypothetical protein
MLKLDVLELSQISHLISFVDKACWDIPNRYTCDVVLNQQARVAHGGGMVDSLPDGPIAEKPMAVQEDAGAYGGYPS